MNIYEELATLYLLDAAYYNENSNWQAELRRIDGILTQLVYDPKISRQIYDLIISFRSQIWNYLENNGLDYDWEVRDYVTATFLSWSEYWNQAPYDLGLAPEPDEIDDWPEQARAYLLNICADEQKAVLGNLDAMFYEFMENELCPLVSAFSPLPQF